MQIALKKTAQTENVSQINIEPTKAKIIDKMVAESWAKISPSWPLKNLIAVNPLRGFEDFPFEDALRQGSAYFQQQHLPKSLHNVNRQTIKWLQAFFDQGQATLGMPMRHLGLFNSIVRFIAFDSDLVRPGSKNDNWFKSLKREPDKIIAECLLFLGIPTQRQATFLTLMLTTLPGWAAYIKYRTEWADLEDANHLYSVSQRDYLALRLLLTCLLWDDAKQLLNWHDYAIESANVEHHYEKITSQEKVYRTDLLEKIVPLPKLKKNPSDAQLVFCIDVRSEPFRRALEMQGNYETFGFAGFFGIPVSIQNAVTGESYASCPVLLKPAHHVVEGPDCNHEACQKKHDRNIGFKKLYQSLKYTFATPFTLAEALGPFAGMAMTLRNFFPQTYARMNKAGVWMSDFQPDLSVIPDQEQAAYAAGALKMMGLTDNFAPLIIFCGHGSETQNNAYGTALDCGACGGHQGSPNARILATILNAPAIRQKLGQDGIDIPADTWFLAGAHNTTTDQLDLFDADVPTKYEAELASLKSDLGQVQQQNCRLRTKELGQDYAGLLAVKHASLRAKDWAQVRPEWGLARNAAFIVGPRELTKNLDLEGRCFLHSYDWMKDPDGSSLNVILTAPMIVAQWINAQYLFSTFDNVAYGGGSKISKNITGKTGIMQGNASDLMHGLPLQSVFKTDADTYHQPLRLMTIVYAPRYMIGTIVANHDILKKLFSHGWVTLVCIEPETGEKLVLNKDFSWQKAH